MGKSFGWVHKDKIQSFYLDLKLVACDGYGPKGKPAFNQIRNDVQASYDRKNWIVYDQRGFWYELEKGGAC